ncbi:MAG: prepilin-type N-terminal cleavage/methylation domain-containing protein [Phycisphaerales bacterium]|nr:MAG: prepilin-type N-terminal cleavage/methylation domain-containing protein [Phycisphaerales bacterium]
MKRSCFTLIELLVVIAIIAFLIAISVSVLHVSKQRARTLLCSSRIMQLTRDLLMYEADNQTFPYGFVDSFTPPPGGYLGSPAHDRMGWWWFHFLKGYNDTKRTLLCCPSKSLNTIRLRESVLHGNYGVNRSVFKSPYDTQDRKEEFAGIPLNSTDVTGGTLLIVDSGYAITSWWHAADVPPVPLINGRGEETAYIPGLEINKLRSLLPGQEQDAIDGRHPNKVVNIGFGDNHVSTTKAGYLLVEKTPDGYMNKSPLWSPK